MGAEAVLSSTVVTVPAGMTASLQLRVRNTATVVDRFDFDILAAPAAWTTVSPPSVSLLPGAEATVTITFAPPRSSAVAAGETPFAIKVASSEDPSGGSVEEGTVTVGAFSDVVVEVVPQMLRGRRRALAELAVDNRSNVAYRAELSGADAEMALGIRFRPPIVDVVPGQAAFAKVAVRPRRRLLRGAALTRSFEIALREDQAASMAALGDAEPTEASAWETTAPISLPGARGSSGPDVAAVHPAELVVKASMVQEPLLGAWPLKVLTALVALAVVGVILWFALVRPQIRSTARNAVTKQLAAAGITQPTPVSAGGAAGGSGSSKGVGSTSVATGAGAVPGTLTVNGDLSATGDGTKTYRVPEGRTLQITDLVVQNAQGDSGTVALSRDGAVLIQWSMATFRDLDYHWVTPLVFGPGSQVQLITSGCIGPCAPGVFYAGNLVPVVSSP